MSAPPITAATPRPPAGPRRPTLMTYGGFLLVGCCLCASLVGSLF